MNCEQATFNNKSKTSVILDTTPPHSVSSSIQMMMTSEPFVSYQIHKTLPRWLSGKESACQCRRCKRHGFYPWVNKIPGEGNGNSFLYSCLGNAIDKGTWRVSVPGMAEESDKT